MKVSVEEGREIFGEARKELRKFFVGYEDLLTCIFLCLVSQDPDSSGHHMLIWGKTGTGKTRISKLIAPVFGLDYKRMDGTGEPMPSDIIGYEDFRTGKIRKGPIFTNVFQADEFNRFSPRSRAALLAPMGESLVTIADTTFTLKPPFTVIATENPASYGDAAPLRAQERDRFALSFYTDWPDEDDHAEIIRMNTRARGADLKLNEVCSRKSLLALGEEIERQIYIDPSLELYVRDGVRRLAPLFSDIDEVGDGEISDTSIVRGGNELLIAARSFAFLIGESGRERYVTPDHIKWTARFALPHRISTNMLDFPMEKKAELVKEAFERPPKFVSMRVG